MEIWCIDKVKIMSYDDTCVKMSSIFVKPGKFDPHKKLKVSNNNE